MAAMIGVVDDALAGDRASSERMKPWNRGGSISTHS
jgi:hypothetical protein